MTAVLVVRMARVRWWRVRWEEVRIPVFGGREALVAYVEELQYARGRASWLEEVQE